MPGSSQGEGDVALIFRDNERKALERVVELVANGVTKVIREILPLDDCRVLLERNQGRSAHLPILSQLKKLFTVPQNRESSVTSPISRPNPELSIGLRVYTVASREYRFT